MGVLAAVYVSGYFLTGSRLPADTTIAQVDVGGMSPSEARTALEDGIADRVEDPIVASHEDQDFELDPAKSGLAVDVPASVDAAGGQRSWNPADMAAVLFGGSDHAPVLDVDQAKLDDAVASIAETVDEPVVEALITFPDAKPKTRQPKAGNEVPQAEFADTLAAAWLMDDDPVEVTVAQVDPAVDAAGLQQALTQIAEPAVAAPVALKVGDKEVDLPVTAYAPALTVEVEGDEMVAKINAEKLAKPLTNSTTGIGRTAVDASFAFEGGKPVVVPSKQGVGLDAETMATALVPVLTETGAARAVEIESTVVEPDFTTKDAEALGIKEKIGEFTTNFPYAEYRNINQGQGAKNLDLTLVKPGETFSFNKTVGERTEANGFVTGFVINGGVFREETGGGVSQVATTTYNAAFFSGLQDVEHHPHAFYISRYPKGREATVYWGHLDLRFKNQYDTGVLIRAWVDPSTPSKQGSMHVEMWGTKVYEVKAGDSGEYNYRNPGTRYDDTDACVPQDPVRGFDIDIYRTFYQDGAKVKTETDTANYQAADKVICGKKPKD